MSTDTINKVTEVNTDGFAQVVEQTEGKILIQFHAPWCAPCKMLAPVVEQVAQDHNDLKVIKVNADDSPELAAKFGVRGLPTLLLMKAGELVATQVGAASLGQVKQFVQQ
ncbi:thioredoxin [Colwellia sp. E2M01]|uniref:thioredoxin n=1 Tax=Colwellia sp. E2M01 TaxID=2841561 RepID=UPI001C094377|nr:thioredoxin [Colwellia sp. E2M01]MBU2869768.1 thioredoxin [Colwellia sp. E2M01]